MSEQNIDIAKTEIAKLIDPSVVANAIVDALLAYGVDVTVRNGAILWKEAFKVLPDIVRLEIGYRKALTEDKKRHIDTHPLQ